MPADDARHACVERVDASRVRTATRFAALVGRRTGFQGCLQFGVDRLVLAVVLLVDRHDPLTDAAVQRLCLLRSLRGIADEFDAGARSEEHTSELQSLMRISYAVFCL